MSIIALSSGCTHIPRQKTKYIFCLLQEHLYWKCVGPGTEYNVAFDAMDDYVAMPKKDNMEMMLEGDKSCL